MKIDGLPLHVVSATREGYILSDGTAQSFIPPLPRDPKVEDIQHYHRLAVRFQEMFNDHFAGSITWNPSSK